jgi:hypothetical protein
VRVRLLFRSDWSSTAEGAYIADIGLNEESSDPDGDGINGILDEYLVHGSDPFLPDSDGDDINDGDEVTESRDPLNPADWPGVTAITTGTLLDFEGGSTGGLATDGSLWAWGAPTSGPNAAFSGSTVWATNPSGNYFSNAVEMLYLPPLDLSNLTSPTLDFRIWVTTMINDGVSLEVNNGSTGWLPHSTVSPAYNGQDGSGAAAWTGLGQGTQYEHASANLQSWAGNLLWVRFVFRADWSSAEAGVYIDDIELTD